MNWNIQNLRGSRETVKAKIASEKVSDDVKAFITQQIDSMAAETVACKLDAYSQDNATDSMKVTRNIQITLVGFKL